MTPTRHSAPDDSVFERKLGKLSAVRAAAPGEQEAITAAVVRQPASPSRTPRRRAKPSKTAQARPDHPHRITVDLSPEQFAMVRSKRTADANVNGLVRALIELADEDPGLASRAVERAEGEA